MAYANWIKPSVTSGNGNDTVNVSAQSDNTGRNVRTTDLTFKAANCQDVVRQVTQSGKPEFVTIQPTASIDKTGGVLTISGKTNSSKLTFSLGESGTLTLSLPEQYTANSLQTQNGVEISGDPGATQEFDFSIQFTGIAENETIDEKTAQLIVRDDAGHSQTCTITQAAGEATLEVTPESIQLDWNASTEETSASFSVTSNTNWTVE